MNEYQRVKNTGRLITKTEAAKRLGVSRPYFYQLIKHKGLPVTVTGRIDIEQMEEWLRTTSATEPDQEAMA
jgi:excisionase family DNA binding protein